MKDKNVQSVVLIDYFLPKNFYTYELCCELSKFADVTLICKDSYEKKSNELFNIKPVLHSKPDRNKVKAFKKYLSDLIKIKKIVEEIKPDVLHVEGIIHHECEVPFYKILKKHVNVFCFTVHNILPHEAKKSDEKKLISICSLADMLVVHNESSKRLLLDHIGDQKKDNVFVIPHGCYTSYHIKHMETGEPVKFLMFGLLRKYKGIDILLNAIALLPKEVTKRCHFVIAGNQQKNYDDTDYIAMRNRLNIDEKIVKFDIRFIPDDTLENYFNEADCIIFPYREIYASGALLMAYSFEKPVIASNIPVYYEETCMGKSGLLFEAGSPQQLANAIESFVKLDKQKLKDYQANVKQLKDEKYSWEQSAKITAMAYRKVEEKYNEIQ